MKRPARWRALLLAGALVAAAAVGARTALAQQAAQQRFRVPSGVGATVSVATLRVPEKAWNHFAKAKAAAEHNRLAESDREAGKALAIAPDFAQAYLLRAHSEVQERSFDAAIADVAEARRVEPDTMWAGIVLAGAYNGLERYDDARQVLAHLRGQEAQTWQAVYEGARAATGLRDVESGLRLSAAALEAAPEYFPEVRLVRSNALLLARRWSEAQEQMQLYLQSRQSEGPPERRAEVLAALENVKRLVAGQQAGKQLQELASR